MPSAEAGATAEPSTAQDAATPSTSSAVNANSSTAPLATAGPSTQDRLRRQGQGKAALASELLSRLSDC